MNEFLTGLFGDNGAVAGELAISGFVLVFLIAGVVWLGRRLVGMRAGSRANGRAPRLAIVDSLSVDARRRLLLVRRDGVEHLILVGGPTDLLVEPSIMRPRPRPAQVPAGGQSMATPMPAGTGYGAEPSVSPPEMVMAAPAESMSRAMAPAAGPPIPFPFSRVPPATASAPKESAARTEANGATASSQFAPATVLNRSPTPALAEREAPAMPPTSKRPPPALPPLSGTFFNGNGVPVSNGNGTAAAGQRPVVADSRGDLTRDAAAAARVSELEAEMHRLLGEIAGERRSP